MSDAVPTPIFRLEGKTIDSRFRIGREVGRGGFGFVHEGRDLHTDKRVAVKFLLPTGPDANSAESHARFKREGKLLGQIRHQNVVDVVDAGTFEEFDYLVMEWVEGVDLAQLAKANGGKLDWHVALRLVGQAARGISAAWAVGIVHRDIKPDNIKVRSSSNEAVVLDFGISAQFVVGDDGESVTRVNRATRVGMLLGTPSYIAPENIDPKMRDKPLDARADVYALAACVYKLCEGKSLWHGRGGHEQILIAAFTEPRPAMTTVPPRVRAFVELCLAVQREHRPWPKWFAEAAEELVRTDGESLILGEMAKTIQAVVSAELLAELERVSAPQPVPELTRRSPTLLSTSSQLTPTPDVRSRSILRAVVYFSLAIIVAVFAVAMNRWFRTPVAVEVVPLPVSRPIATPLVAPLKVEPAPMVPAVKVKKRKKVVVKPPVEEPFKWNE